MEIWTGDIALDVNDPTQRLTEVQLFAPGPGPDHKIIVGQDVSFHFLSLIQPNCVPLHLLAGPALDVYSTSEATESWLEAQLIESCIAEQLESEEHDPGDAKWWQGGSNAQSEVGVLLRVEGELRVTVTGPRVSELLVYAAVSREAERDQMGILTPPRSSSPNPEVGTTIHRESEQGITARIYALPLSSEIRQAIAPSLQPHSPPPELQNQPQPQEIQARFLPPFPRSQWTERPTPRKRQRLTNLFDEATQQNKRTKRRGGESVAKAMANLNNNTPSTLFSSKAPAAPHDPHREPDIEPLKPGRRRRTTITSLARAPSINSLKSDIESANPPPRQTGATPALSKRSSLHRVTSAPRALETSSPAPEILIPSIEDRNKAALTRVVMAGMRMYGLFQQRKRPDTAQLAMSEAGNLDPPTMTTTTTATTTTATTTTLDELDLYKATYHHCFKAASFALRGRMAVGAVGPRVMREMVDRLLALFCVEPCEEVVVGLELAEGDCAVEGEVAGDGNGDGDEGGGGGGDGGERDGFEWERGRRNLFDAPSCDVGAVAMPCTPRKGGV